MVKLLMVALAERYRFASAKGDLTLEDLFQLPMTQLNDVAIRLHEQAEVSTVSFIEPASKKGSLAATKLQIVKEVIAYRQEKRDIKATAVKRKQERSKLDELIAQKEDESLSNLSVEELIALRDKV
ncbi:hypothetical protein NVP1152O_073 [Vibrio phage 1.152.O._10N.222.46.E1]|uniref:Coil containing protein n=5 Tax=Nahantvirus 49C7 TaxID=2846601 RepID=A0A2I7RBH0_9CAUD|nr:hypothetical protein HYP57_gp072 [Vibrio phage 1.026.O._10N.222.49.C7]AUR82555.1 hypothetical protein NVP1025O_072 [Vibrio phage 1.025.O._10N.222.46.B6]AUR90805.1 hypothetical protein NVP1150O_072 [Vibrio phage 1.150.O._10N.222.46.A6]AUR90978.1 hypothetical protein NVP1152O_073 [Vibrio phage 1.152.O._10N.222.46.E1]AUS02446.1 hypothetical protein NVP2130O_072 [Vibrio phage 2.130.O._10N.222.46.C2]AUR82663.1 hypothetical protein NVP1026O_072 [Vibrio phage 1.026.O._10N.222.49.C7]